MSHAENRTVALADRFEFVERMKRSQRLPPRGQFRVIAADVRGPAPRRFPHTLFFSSLLAAPLYQELDRGALHAAGRRQTRSVQHRGTDAGRLRFDRRHAVSAARRAAPRLPALRRRADRAGATPERHRLHRPVGNPGVRDFRALAVRVVQRSGQQPLSPRVVARVARVSRVRVIRYSAPETPLPDVCL